jgi:hypothetical protein
MNERLIIVGFSLFAVAAVAVSVWLADVKFHMCRDTGRNAVACLFVALAR